MKTTDTHKVAETQFGFGLLILSALIALLISFPLSASAGTDTAAEEPVVETVKVENVEVPVRVFLNKQQVDNLTKEDFQLLVDGKPMDINGFYMIKNKLQKTAAGNGDGKELTVQMEPRLFVLIFNLSDHHQDLQKGMDVFFKHIIRPGDRVMAITNHFFLSEFTVKDPESAQMRVMNILEKELANLKPELLWFENQLKAAAATLKSRLEDDSEKKDSDFPTAIFREFFTTYRFIIEDIRNYYLKLPVDQYIKIAQYLKGQRTQKWVLNFYQLSHFPLLDEFGQVSRKVEEFTGKVAQTEEKTGLGPSRGYKVNTGVAKQNIQTLKMDFNQQLHQYDDKLAQDIGKAFIDTGATFHTLLLKPVNPGFSQDFKYESVTTNTEIILKNLSAMTGGRIILSNNMDKFVDKITEIEDIVYMLTYVPDPGKKRDKYTPVQVKLKDMGKKYKVVFDNRNRMYNFRKAVKDLETTNPEIEIEKVVFKKNRLLVKLKNIKMVDYDGDSYGAVNAKIKILDKNSIVINEFEKTYKGIKENGVFLADIPTLGTGNFSIVLEVKDLFSLTNTVTGESVGIQQ